LWRISKKDVTELLRIDLNPEKSHATRLRESRGKRKIFDAKSLMIRASIGFEWFAAKEQERGGRMISNG